MICAPNQERAMYYRMSAMWTPRRDGMDDLDKIEMHHIELRMVGDECHRVLRDENGYYVSAFPSFEAYADFGPSISDRFIPA